MIKMRMVSRLHHLLLAALALVSGIVLSVHATGASASISQSDDRTAFVLMSAGSRSTTMSGSTDDLSRARALRSGQEALLYVRRSGAEYVIRDAETLRRAAAIFAPQEALGARQAELGSRQAALGSRQARLGAEQARLGHQQSNASPKRQQELGRLQNALGEQQNALGRQQNELGRQQNLLGREQDRLARAADAQMRALLDEAIQQGTARRVD